IAACCTAPPLSSREKPYAGQIAGCQLHLEPLRIVGQLAPHRSTPKKQQRAAQSVLAMTIEVRIANQMTELLAVFFKLRMMKFTSQEFGDYFLLIQRTNHFQAGIGAHVFQR